MDETIWSSENAIISAIHQTLISKSTIDLDKEQIRDLLRKNNTFNDVLKKYGEYSLSQYWRQFRKTIEKIDLFFPNTLTVFKTFKENGKKIGFVTSLKKEFSIYLLKKFELFSLADVIITPSECRVPKPNPRSINMAIAALNLETENVIYIGDSENDMKAAKTAGCLAGLAKWGNHQEISIKLDYEFSHLEDTLKLT